MGWVPKFLMLLLQTGFVSCLKQQRNHIYFLLLSFMSCWQNVFEQHTLCSSRFRVVKSHDVFQQKWKLNQTNLISGGSWFTSVSVPVGKKEKKGSTNKHKSFYIFFCSFFRRKLTSGKKFKWISPSSQKQAFPRGLLKTVSWQVSQGETRTRWKLQGKSTAYTLPCWLNCFGNQKHKVAQRVCPPPPALRARPSVDFRDKTGTCVESSQFARIWVGDTTSWMKRIFSFAFFLS